MIISLGLGANLGQPLRTLERARAELASILDQSRISSIYLTTPYDKTDQPLYYNQVITGTTTVVPHELLLCLKGIEAWLGRRPRTHWGPREIDIDILMIDGVVLNEGPVLLPHPRIQERDFVLAPLAELHPTGKHPTLDVSWRDLLARIPASQRTIIKTIKQE